MEHVESPQKKKSSAVHFLESLTENDSVGCINWPFKKTKAGYGRVYYEGRDWRAHRLSLTLHVGPAPSEKHYAAHEPVICHNPSCVNPKHLRWALPKENAQDREKDGTKRLGEDVATSKLSEADVIEIKRRLRKGDSLSEISKCYPVTTVNISAIKTGKSWGWVS